MATSVGGGVANEACVKIQITTRQAPSRHRATLTQCTEVLKGTVTRVTQLYRFNNKRPVYGSNPESYRPPLSLNSGRLAATRKLSRNASAVSDAPHSKCAGRLGKSCGARPIQLFEGSRAWEGIYANSNGVGVMRQAWEIGGGVSKSAGRIGPVVFCVGLGRKFEARLGAVSWFGGQKSAPRRQVARRTE